MDGTREHLLSRMLLERQLVGDDELRRYASERDELLRRGSRITLGQLAVRDRRIEAAMLVSLQNEIEVRGRACFTCRRAYLVAPGGSPNCPVCGAPALLPALPSQTASGRFAPTSGPAVQDYSQSGRFQPQRIAPGEASPSGRFRATNGAMPVPPAPALAVPGVSSRAIPQAMPGALVRSDMGPTPQPTSPPPPGSTPGGRSTAPGSGAGTPPPGGKAKIEAGKTFGNYELLDELGRGGMGVVYKARPLAGGDLVALKVLLAGEFASAKLVTRFKDEAKTVQKLDHRGIVPVYDAGEVDGLPFFTMKFIKGTLFEDMITKGRMPVKRGAEILREVAKAAHHAHQHGVVHRDLKPSNVIVDDETDQPFIMDFGLAKDLDDDKHLTRSGVAIGTPYYMPPEQAQGRHREVDARTDVYAIGAMLYQVLAKRPPFTAETQNELLKKIVEEEPVPPSQSQRGVPPALEIVALKALRKKMDERYPSANALAQDIDRALGGRKIVAKREAVWAPLQRRFERNPKLILGVSAAVLLAGLGIAYGVHAANEAERIRIEAEEKAKRDQEEADRKAKEAEEKARADARRAAAEKALGQAHEKRLQARLAATAPGARGLLEDAERGYGEAIASLDAPPEAHAQACYERALVRRDLARRGELDMILKDLSEAAKSKTYQARARFAGGALLLRREHDDRRARPELELARLSPELLDPNAMLDEQTAGNLAQAYLTLLQGDAAEALRKARDAERAASSELLPDVCEAVAWLRLDAAPAGDAGAAVGRTTVTEIQKGALVDRWRPALIVLRAWARTVAGDLGAAEEDLKTARLVAPYHPDGLAVDAWLAARNGNDEGVKKAIQDGRDFLPSAGTYWDALETKLAAVAQAAKTSTAGPRSTALFTDIPINGDSSLGPKFQGVRELLSRGQLDPALERLVEIEKLDTGHPDLCLWRARLLCEAKRWSDARTIVEVVLGRSSENTLACCLLGWIQAETGQLDQARATLLAVQRRYPELRTPRVLLAVVLFEAERWDEVVSLLDPIVANDPGDSECTPRLAVSLQRLGRHDRAVEIAKAAVQTDSMNPQVRTFLSQTYIRAGRFKDALDFAEQGEQLLPNAIHIIIDKAVALWCLKRAVESGSYFDKARALATNDEDRAGVDRIQRTVQQQFPR